MKYIKKYEDTNGVYSIDLIPGQIYSCDDMIFCYVGNTGKEPFNFLCFLLGGEDRFDKFYFIEWNSWFFSKAIRLHKDIKEYIIEKNLVEKTTNSLIKCAFSEQPTTKVRKMAYDLRDRLRNDPDIKMIIDANKYNI